MPGQQRQAQGAKPEETGEIRGPPPLGALAEACGVDAVNADAAPRLRLREQRFRLVISAPAGDNRDLVAALGQTQGNLGQVLPGRHHVRVKGLVEQKKSH